MERLLRGSEPTLFSCLTPELYKTWGHDIRAGNTGRLRRRWPGHRHGRRSCGGWSSSYWQDKCGPTAHRKGRPYMTRWASHSLRKAQYTTGLGPWLHMERRSYMTPWDERPALRLTPPGGVRSGQLPDSKTTWASPSTRPKASLRTGPLLFKERKPYMTQWASSGSNRGHPTSGPVRSEAEHSISNHNLWPRDANQLNQDGNKTLSDPWESNGPAVPK